MRLDWYKLVDTESSWGSDTFLVFAMVMKWYYYHITTLQSDSPYMEPKSPIKMLYTNI